MLDRRMFPWQWGRKRNYCAVTPVRLAESHRMKRGGPLTARDEACFVLPTNAREIHYHSTINTHCNIKTEARADVFGMRERGPQGGDYIMTNRSCIPLKQQLSTFVQ